MIKLISIQYSLVTIIITSMLLFVPLMSYSDEYTNEFIPSTNSPYDVSLQYQIRDNSQNLICIVESTVTNYFDSSKTREYLDTHPNHKSIEQNSHLINYVLIKDSWRVGQGDSFLSNVKHIIKDSETGYLIPYFFAATNGCAVQPGDMVTAYWKIFYF